MLTKYRSVNPLDAHAHLPVNEQAHKYCLAGCFPKEWSYIEKQSKKAFRIGFGHHPWFATEEPQHGLLISLLAKHPNAFVGEIGLDRSKKHQNTIEKQKEIFVDQLIIAKRYKRPVAIHLVRASAIGYDLIHQYYGPKVYLHGYICSVEEARMYPHAFFGFHIRMFQSPKTAKLIASLPIQQILVESDGESKPDQLRNTIAQISNIKGMNQKDVILETFQNALRWLNIE